MARPYGSSCAACPCTRTRELARDERRGRRPPPSRGNPRAHARGQRGDRRERHLAPLRPRRAHRHRGGALAAGLDTGAARQPGARRVVRRRALGLARSRRRGARLCSQHRAVRPHPPAAGPVAGAAAAGARGGAPEHAQPRARQQLDCAARRIRDSGLDDRVTLLLEDYRDLRGRYDKLVSIEMIEAVGSRDFGTFFGCCSELLEPDGTMLLQAITIDDRAYEVERLSASFIREMIFPDGCLPSLGVISSRVAKHTDLRFIGLEDISAHYVPTLRAWRANLEGSADELRRRGYDERFQR